MKNSPFFSVVIPCYNVADTIKPTLDTLINQNFTDFEIIFVDDGSTDNTYLILSDFKSLIKNKVVLLTQVNKGLGAARNSGIKASNGQYIALLDADDTWLSNKLYELDKIIKCNNNFELFCHNEFIINNKGTLIKKNIYGSSETFEDLIYNGNCLSPSAVVIHRNIFQKVGYFTEDRNYHGVEDYDFWLRSSLEGIKFYYISQFLGNYIIHDNNMSTSLKFINTEEKILFYYIYNYRSRLSQNYKIKKRLLFFYLRKLYLYLKSYNLSYLPFYLSDTFCILFNLNLFIKKKLYNQ